LETLYLNNVQNEKKQFLLAFNLTLSIKLKIDQLHKDLLNKVEEIPRGIVRFK
jgi:hypothetical protein